MSEENVTALKVGTGIAPVLPNVRFPRRWKFGRAVHTKTSFRRQYSTAAGVRARSMKGETLCQDE
nr:MAG TPA: hypothetical protein [Caudoviricetes sp.]